jgi:hypothetical protein
MKQKRVYYKEILLFVVSLCVMYFATFAKIDSYAKERLDSSFQQALGVFATAKALNAVISLVQGTEVGPPGVTLTIGEVLDPINDLVERFSWVMLASLSSLGIQKILFNIVTCKGFNAIIVFLLMLFNLIYFARNRFEKRFVGYAFNIVILVVFVRFSIPLMTFANDFVYDNFVRSEYSIAKAQEEISKTQNEFSKFDESKTSLFSSNYYKKKLNDFKIFASKASDNIVDLIIVFIFKAIFFPLVFILILYRIIQRLLI